MIPSKWAREHRMVLPILLVALAVRFYQIGWGLPFVFEEATPLKTAWAMWEWGAPAGVDLNPHFFKYPSLTIYLQFAAQGLLFLVMRLGGLIGSAVDYHARYLVDPSPFYYVGRSISVLFGVGTVWLVYQVGRLVAIRWAAVAAAGLLAINTFHVSRSHLIEVDLPLTFFVMLALWLSLRFAARPSPTNYALAGVAAGLAASAKYTGAMLVLPILAAHILACRTDKNRPRWWYLLVSVSAAAMAFVLTSPYVLLDAGTFTEHFGAERQHMRLGHFGLGGSSSWVFYARSLMGSLLGWPTTVLALSGLIFLAFIRRRGPALVLAAFVIPYVLAVSSWSMHAERYLLPVIPVFIVFAAAVIGEAFAISRVSRWPDRVRVGAAATLLVVLAIPVATQYPSYWRSIRSDTRSAAAEWIEASIPSGSYLVIEPYGPDLFGPQKLSQLSSAVRKEVLVLKKDSPNYAILWVPMFQVMPERSEVFYDHSLYENADYVVSTGAMRSRYTNEPARFRRQLAFYDKLEAEYTKVAEFTPGGGGGSEITVYKNPRHDKPFNKRAKVAPPPQLRHERDSATGSEELFYFNVGINYEVFLRLPEAIASYELAFRYPVERPSTFKNLVLRKTHCLLMSGRRQDAVDYLQAMILKAPTRGVREHLQSLSESIQERGRSEDR